MFCAMLVLVHKVQIYAFVKLHENTSKLRVCVKEIFVHGIALHIHYTYNHNCIGHNCFHVGKLDVCKATFSTGNIIFYNITIILDKLFFCLFDGKFYSHTKFFL